MPNMWDAKLVAEATVTWGGGRSSGVILNGNQGFRIIFDASADLDGCVAFVLERDEGDFTGGMDFAIAGIATDTGTDATILGICPADLLPFDSGGQNALIVAGVGGQVGFSLTVLREVPEQGVTFDPIPSLTAWPPPAPPAPPPAPPAGFSETFQARFPFDHTSTSGFLVTIPAGFELLEVVTDVYVAFDGVSPTVTLSLQSNDIELYDGNPVALGFARAYTDPAPQNGSAGQQVQAVYAFGGSTVGQGTIYVRIGAI
jgi:hypothetical protein